MRHETALPDRLAFFSLRLIGAINLVFLAVFLAGLLLVAGRAGAQEQPVCAGKDLLAEMERDDPELLRTVRAEAAATANGQALLWRVERPGAADSFLFGTMHMADPRVLGIPAPARAALDGAETLVIETTDILDPSAMVAAMLARPELTMFTDDTTLFSLMSPQDRKTAETALSQRGIPPASVAKMKPWMLSATLAMPACEMSRKAGGAPVLDIVLAQEALAAGRNVEGLESMAEQFDAMASLPMEFHIEGLISTLELGDRAEDVMETMVVLYAKGEPGMFWPFFRAVLPSGEAGYAAFEAAMVTDRNRTMAARATPFLEEGGAFVAVGALHLPGEDGLVALLSRQGFRLSAVH